MDSIIGNHKKYPQYILRNYLLTQNYTFNLVIEKIKKLQKRKRKTKYFKAIYNLSYYLNVNPKFIQDYIKLSDYNLRSPFHHPDLVIYTKFSFKPEMGMYIRISPDLPEPELIILYREFKKHLKKEPFESTKRRVNLQQLDLKLYLACEEQIVKVVNYNKKRKAERDNVVISDACERAAIKLRDEKLLLDDELSLAKKIRETHKKVEKIYHLPEYKQLQNLMQLIRL